MTNISESNDFKQWAYLLNTIRCLSINSYKIVEWLKYRHWSNKTETLKHFALLEWSTEYGAIEVLIAKHIQCNIRL